MPPSANPGAYRRLTTALTTHRGDLDAYRRLGEQLRERRVELDPRYDNRRLFVHERVVPLDTSSRPPEKKESAWYKLVYDLEAAKGWGRGGFSAGKILTAAEAYGVTPESIADVLDGAPLTAARAPEVAPADAAWLRVAMSDEQLAERRPYAAAIYAGLRRWTVGYARKHPDVDPENIPEPPGTELFLDAPQDATTWDARADLPTDERVWLIAALQARQAAARRRDTGVG